MDFLATLGKRLNLSDMFVSSTQANRPSATAGTSQQQPDDEMDGKESTSQFGSALETMDRFLENDSNLLVQSLVSLESRTNISRRYLARAFLLILTGYFLFSNGVLDLITHLLAFLYPSYRSYLLLKNENLSKQDLVDMLKYWIFIGLFTSVDFVLGYLVPFVSVFKLLFIIQCVLPAKSPAVAMAHTHFVTPLYRYLEQSQTIQEVNVYVNSLTDNLKSSSNGDHQD